MSVAWPFAVAINLNARQRDAFLKALEEAQRAALAGTEATRGASKAFRSSASKASTVVRDAIDRLKGTLRSYISAGLASRLYADAPQTRSREARRPPAAQLCEQEQVLAELHLTSALTSHDLKLIRRKFAMANHPDRVAPQIRERATRRMTIANTLIDEALRERNSRTQ